MKTLMLFKRFFLSLTAIVCSVFSLIILIIAGIGLLGGKEKDFWILFCFAFFWLCISKLALYLRKKMDDVQCPSCGYKFKYLDEPEAGMGYVKCPKCQKPVTQKDIIK